jgi:predicted Rossmann fold nucleotide-binding protein DprA/Smf involved in DNA uptake
MRLPAAWRSGLAAGRLLLLSSFVPKQRRATGDLAQRRNTLVAALADVIFLAHAAAGGKTEELSRQALAWGKPVWVLDHASNQPLLAAGARPVTAAGAADAWRAHRAAGPTDRATHPSRFKSDS